MKKMRKQISLLLMAGMLASLVFTGCGSNGAAQTGNGSTPAASAAATGSGEKVNYPTKPITMIVPFAAGGGTDTGARLMAAEVEKILKVPVTVVNKPGASGWMGWTELLSSDKDGYTIAHFNDIDVIAGYLDKQQQRKNTIKDFAPIYCYVSDPQVIAINPNNKNFTNIQELIEYAKKNEVTVAIPGNPSLIAMTRINNELGTKFLAIRNKGAAESLPAIMGGHVDVMLNTVGETRVPAKANQIKPLAVLATERTDYLPDVPTFKETIKSDIVSSSVRGFAAPAGVPQEIMDILIKAFEEGAQTENFKTKMAEQGLPTVSISGAEYGKVWEAEEAAIKEVVDTLGWN